MKMKLLKSIVFTALLTVAGCAQSTPKQGGGDDPVDPIDPVVTEDSWTILVYMCGSDLESQTYEGQTLGYASIDISEMLSAKSQPADVNIVLETGGASKWASTHGIKSNELGRYHIRDNELVKDGSVSKASMGNSNTFQSFLTWGMQTYPADKYGVILWNHGGALSGVCFDENYNDSLTDDEVVKALKNTFNTLNRTEKLEWIGYDACLMSVQDIAEFNSPYFNYMVAAEETEVGEGWAYQPWLEKLYQKYDTKTVLKEICDSFIKSVDDMYEKYSSEGYSKENNDQNLAVIDLNKISNYKTKFEFLISSMSSTLKSGLSSFKKNILLKSKMYANTYMSEDEIEYYGYSLDWCEGPYHEGRDTYYMVLGAYLYGTIDAMDVLNKMAKSSSYSSYSNQIKGVINALKEAIVYNAKGAAAGESNGLALVVMLERYGVVDYNSSYTHFNNWRNIFA